jgi:LysM repeat protein
LRVRWGSPQVLENVELAWSNAECRPVASILRLGYIRGRLTDASTFTSRFELANPAGEISMLHPSVRKLRFLVTSVLLGGSVLAPSASAQQSATPSTHTVRPGDTLWGLAQHYFGDPLLWPEIYRLNTMVVEDPHWIYPGEVLRLSGSEAVSAVPADTTEAADTTVAQAPAAPLDTTHFGGPAGTGEPTLAGFNMAALRPVHRGEFYSSGFLTEQRALPYGRLLGGVTPSQIGGGDGGAYAALSLYTTVAVRPAKGVTYQVGDSLLVGQLGPSYAGYGEAFQPTGLIRVTGLPNGKTVGEVVAVYGPLRAGQLVLPAEKFVEPSAERPVAVANGVRASVLESPRPQVLTGPLDVLFLTKGRQDGVAPGDVFEVRRMPETTAEGAVRIDELMAVLQVVRTGERTATVRVVRVISPDIRTGTEARQVAKLPG